MSFFGDFFDRLIVLLLFSACFGSFCVYFWPSHLFIVVFVSLLIFCLFLVTSYIFVFVCLNVVAVPLFGHLLSVI